MSIYMKTNFKEVYTVHAIILRQVRQEKDIRVIMDDQLKFESHMLEKKLGRQTTLWGLSGEHLYI